MKQSLAQDIIEKSRTRKRFGVLTRLHDDWQILLDSPKHTDLTPSLQPLWDKARSSLFTHDDVQYFLQIYRPSRRMIIIGAVHIAQYLYHFAQQAEYDVIIIDPRAAWGRAERFADISVITKWPDEVLPDYNLDQDTAMVALTHDPKIDDVALGMALDSDIGYIGALGSKKTHAARVARLQDAGRDDAAIARIHAPIGLNIGAASPAEIALAIMAEIIANYAIKK